MKQIRFKSLVVLMVSQAMLCYMVLAETRTWTYKNDFTGEAELLGLDEKLAVLKFKKSNQIRVIPFSQLSGDDRNFIFKSDHFRKTTNLLKNPGFEAQHGPYGWNIDLWSHTDTRDENKKKFESAAEFQISNEHCATGNQSLRVFSMKRKNNYPDEKFSTVSVRSNYLKIDKEKTYFVSGKVMVNKPIKNMKFVFSSPNYSDKDEHAVFRSGPLHHLESLEPGVWHQFDSVVADLNISGENVIDHEWKYMAVEITAFLYESQDEDFCFYVDDFYIGEKPE